MGRKKETRLQRNKHVRMNIGLMALQGTDLKPLRGKTVPLLVDPEAAAADLLERGVREMRMFNEDMKEGPFVLLYPDCSEVVHMPGSERPFNLAEYKKELGKPYSRITIYICLETHFKEGCVKADFGTSLDENEPEPPQIKEEEEEVCTSVREEQLELKQETETLMSTPTCEEGEDQTESAAETIVMVMVKEEPVSKVKLETNTVSPEQQHVCKEEQLLTDQEKNRDDPEPPEINEESDTDDSDYWSRYEPKRQKRLSYSNDKKSKNHLETNTEPPSPTSSSASSYAELYFDDEEELLDEEDDEDEEGSSGGRGPATPTTPAPAIASTSTAPSLQPPQPQRWGRKKRGASTFSPFERSVLQAPPVPPPTPPPQTGLSPTDEDGVFFLSLLPTLRRLPLRKKSEVKFKIHQLLFEAEQGARVDE